MPHVVAAHREAARVALPAAVARPAAGVAVPPLVDAERLAGGGHPAVGPVVVRVADGGAERRLSSSPTGTRGSSSPRGRRTRL